MAGRPLALTLRMKGVCMAVNQCPAPMCTAIGILTLSNASGSGLDDTGSEHSFRNWWKDRENASG